MTESKFYELSGLGLIAGVYFVHAFGYIVTYLLVSYSIKQYSMSFLNGFIWLGMVIGTSLVPLTSLTIRLWQDKER